MTRMICRRWRGCFAGLLCFGLTPLCAQETLPEQGAWHTGALSGYAWGDRNLDSVPVNFHIGYTLFKGKPRLPLPAGALEVAVEPFFAAVTRHSDREGTDASLEAGLMLGVFSYHIDLGRGWSPYLEGGVGVLRHDFEGYKLGGGFNFTQMLGAGLAARIGADWSLRLGYRYRHSSNAGLYEENRGLDTQSFMAGLLYAPRAP